MRRRCCCDKLCDIKASFNHWSDYNARTIRLEDTSTSSADIISWEWRLNGDLVAGYANDTEFGGGRNPILSIPPNANGPQEVCLKVVDSKYCASETCYSFMFAPWCDQCSYPSSGPPQNVFIRLSEIIGGTCNECLQYSNSTLMLPLLGLGRNSFECTWGITICRSLDVPVLIQFRLFNAYQANSSEWQWQKRIYVGTSPAAFTGGAAGFAEGLFTGPQANERVNCIDLLNQPTVMTRYNVTGAACQFAAPIRFEYLGTAL